MISGNVAVVFNVLNVQNAQEKLAQTIGSI